MRAQHHNVTHAIVLFVAPSALVLANDVAVVLIDGTAGDDADLLVVAHDQAIEIETRCFFVLKRAFLDELFEVCERLRVHLIAVDRRAIR